MTVVRTGVEVETDDKADNAPVLAAEHLRMVYRGTDSGAKLAVEDVSFSVSKGEFVCVVGPSGGGKTTLLRMLAGLVAPTAGHVTFEGRPVKGVPDHVSVVFQDYSRSLFPWSRVIRNVSLPLRVRGVSRRASEQAAREVLRSVDLAGTESSYPWQLSGGMQQRVAIARSLVDKPDLLLMDEPFASVDAQTRLELQDLTLRVRDEFGITVVLVTHDIEEAAYLSDRVVVLSGSPSVVRKVVDVDLPYPRDSVKTRNDPTFAQLRTELLELVARR